MTGRDLIIYILKNNLEDVPIFKDGEFLGFITAEEAAVKLNVGVATVYAWVELGKMHGIKIDNTLFIPACEMPIVCESKGVKNA